jgi:hypothetical protein
MKTAVVRYQVKPERAAENEALIQQVYEELARDKPRGMRYQTMKLADGVSFIHVASYDERLGANPLTQLHAFQNFVAGINDRCEVQPVNVQASVVGRYDSLD